MGRVKCDHIKRLITLTSDNIKRFSLYLTFFQSFLPRQQQQQQQQHCNFCLDEAATMTSDRKAKQLFG